MKPVQGVLAEVPGAQGVGQGAGDDGSWLQDGLVVGQDDGVGEMASAAPGFDTLDAAADYWRELRPGITGAALASRIDHTIRRGKDGRWNWTLDMAGIAQARLSGGPAGQIDLWACVDALRCPALVLRGEHTDFLPVATCERMAARQPLLSWAEVPGAGHYAHDDNPEFFLNALRDFLHRIEE